ncbi:MAG: nucleoside monophosphate kinase [Phycisphaeraceae bacterium]|nr:nucleoside monophosphate kinase [Phycisphaeraceae bacterium]
MADKYKTILLFGAPGSGKGTQGKVLGSVPGYYHCSCGDVFRNMDVNSELGKVFLQYSTKGLLVPDDFTVKLWQDAINKHAASGKYKPNRDLLILDGIPRTLAQAQIMDDLIDVLVVVHLVCHDQEKMIDRLRRRALKENRKDDADENVIRKRWSVYEAETQPVLGHYPQSLIAEVDAVQTPGQVLRDALNVVLPIHEKAFPPYAG